MSRQGEETEIAHTVRAFFPRTEYLLTRALFLRALGFIYFVAFLSLHHQVLPLVGSDGLLPVDVFLESYRAFSTDTSPYLARPTLFWIDHSDFLLSSLSALGVVLSVLAMLGLGCNALFFVLWLLELSFFHVGQVFYGYGWELLLLETGMLAVFLAPARPACRTEKLLHPPAVLFVLLRWVLFRLMFGAGLIKLRGDPCWTDLTCLEFHYETQPSPHPVSWLLHQAPSWFHQAGVLFNHFVELVVPFFVFGPRRARWAAGLLIILFQVFLILSGNLSFLNWLTIAIALGCFDDEFFAHCRKKVRAPKVERWLKSRWEKLMPQRLVPSWAGSLSSWRPAKARASSWSPRRVVTYGYVILVTALSLNPVSNLLGPHQRMNASFTPLHLVNSYGAFGSIGRKRREIIVEGTRDRPGPDAVWKAYEFPCKPGAITRAPCLATPYHYRLGWQFWFAPSGTPETEAWLVHLVAQLLDGNPTALSLVEHNPFPHQPPRYIRARLMEYRFTSFGEEGYWERRFLGTFLRPLSKDDPVLQRFLENHGFRSTALLLPEPGAGRER